MKEKSLTQALVDAAKGLKFEKATIDKLEALNVPQVRALKPKDIKRIRKKINVSQGVFAVILNVNPSTVQKWEQGSTTPSGSALRLLNLLEDRGRSLIRSQERTRA